MAFARLSNPLKANFVENLRIPIQFQSMLAEPQGFQPNAPAPERSLVSLVAALSAPLPDSYLAFLRRTNGGEGFIGERYVRLWAAEQLIEMNRGYKVAEFFPGLFFIGTDGGGEAYAFNTAKNDPTVLRVPFIGLPSDAKTVASSFDSFLGGAVG